MFRARFAVVLSVAAAGCLSGGPPPTGQRLAVGRTPIVISFLRAGPASPVLLWQGATLDGPVTFDLHLLTSSPGEDATMDRRLAEHARFAGFLPVVDSRGRLAINVSSTPDPSSGAIDLVLVDTGTGQPLDLGPGSIYAQSPSGDRIAYRTQDGQMRIHEIDDRDALLDVHGDSINSRFLGEDLYYQVYDYLGAGELNPPLWRLSSDGAPERLADSVTSFQIIGPFVFLTRNDAAGMAATLSMLDPTTLRETALPASRAVSVSPDGRWVFATTDPTGPEMATSSSAILFDPATGATQPFELPTTFVSQVFWRPGAAGEAWISSFGTVIAKPGVPPVNIARQTYAPWDPSAGNNLAFTSDGAYFFAAALDAPFFAEKSGVFVVPVDDPLSPGIRLNPEGSGLTSVSEVPDGRLLAGVWYKDPDRSDVVLFDLGTGTSRPLGEAGSIIAVGERRVLAVLHRIKGAGDLTLIDLDTGASTKLAESVGQVVVERHDGTDALAPGTRVAYNLENPIASPYDGAWLVTLR